MFTVVYTNFSNFVALEFKVGLVFTFSQLCLTFPNFILKLKHLRKQCNKMLNPQNFSANV